jgi:uncharacterized membrane protein (UPF0127 family)
LLQYLSLLTFGLIVSYTSAMKKALLLLLPSCFIFILLLLSACQRGSHVDIKTQMGETVSFQIEIADTPASREQGLQYRETLSASQGMLFVFPDEDVRTFWMKNTPLPLDLIFISADLKIVGIIPNTTPFSLAPLSVSKPSRYVLEIKGGAAESAGIHTGDNVNLQLT